MTTAVHYPSTNSVDIAAADNNATTDDISMQVVEQNKGDGIVTTRRLMMMNE